MSELTTTEPTPTLRPTHLRPAPPTSNKASTAHARLIELATPFHELIKGAPTLSRVVGERIMQQLALDAQATGLAFTHEGTTNFVSLAHLCVFAHQHPLSVISLPDGVRLVHGSDGRTVAGTTVEQLLSQLPALDLHGALVKAWYRYWNACQPDTASTRSAHAQALYQQHVLASLQASQPRLSDDAVASALVEAALAQTPSTLAGDRPVVVRSTFASPGALVFSLEAEGATLLYRPDRFPAITVHATDAALWLELTGHPDAAVPLQRLEHVKAGFTLWHDLLFQRLAATLEQAPGDDLWRDAPRALEAAQRLSTEWHGTPLLAMPSAEDQQPMAADPLPSLFDLGGLQLDVPPQERTAQISQQLERVSRAVEQDPEALADCQAALVAAQQAALPEIEAHLHSPHWHSDAAPLVFSAALIEAHRQGLLAHARLKRLMGELDDLDVRCLETVATAADPQASSHALRLSHPMLLQAPPPEGNDVVQAHTLSDAIVITRTASDGVATMGDLLFYWLGEHGGLLRCRDHAELEHCLGIHPEHGQSLAYVPVSGTVFEALLRGVIAHGQQLRQQIQDEGGLAAVAQALPELHECMAQRLQVPRHAARDAALHLLEQQQRALDIARAVPAWLTRLSLESRMALNTVVEAYVLASQQAHALVVRDLPVRAVYCRARVAQRLRQDFPAYDGRPVTIDVPVSTTWQDDPIAGSGAPGVPVKQRLVPSAARVSLALEDLLLNNVDDAMLLRLRFLSVQIDTQDLGLRQALDAGLTFTSLQALARELDLAHAYENVILNTYRGLQENTCAMQWRRACLTRPLRLMLEIQGILLQGRGTLDGVGHDLLKAALNARTQADGQATGHDIRLLPALLTTGGPDTDDRATTLSGVTFIEDRISGVTLLCQPEHPHLPLSQYNDLESARWALYQSIVSESDVTYLASRALQGDPRAHRSRLQQARIRGFDGIIGIGTAWPAHLSLPALLLEAQLGKVIAAHRASSRSNDDLWLESFTRQSGMIFDYLKMALSVMPFIGSAIAAYDFAHASARAAEAFIEGEMAQGVNEVNNALLALIDVVLDLVSGVAINVSLIRQASRQRQLRQLHAGIGTGWRTEPSRQRGRSTLDGYAYARPLSLQGVKVGTEGRYTGIYRHAEGDFILVEGRPFEVTWDAAAHTWRLKGTPGHHWQRAVALDERGRWDTHFSLYGVHLYGGGAGGGQTLGRVADQLEPYWPAAIRDRLPRFLVDRHYRRQRMLQTQCYNEEAQLQRSLAHSNQLFMPFNEASPADQVAQVPALIEATQADLRLAKQLYRSWDDYLRLSAGRNRRVPLQQKAQVARVICDRLLNQIQLHVTLSRQSLTSSMLVQLRLNEIHGLVDQAPLLREARKLALAQLGHRERLFKTLDDIETWYPLAERSTALRQSVETTRAALSSEFKAFYQTQHLMIASQRYTTVSVVAEFLLENLQELESDVLSVRSTLLDLRDVGASVAQRRQIHHQARETFARYKRQLQSTEASMPALFDASHLQQLHDNLDTLLTLIERKLRRLPALSAGRGGPASSPRLFLDTENRLHVGDFVAATAHGPEQMVMRGDDGLALKRFLRAQGDRWQPQVSASSRARELRDVQHIASELLGGLTPYRAKVQQYQRHGMLAVDLEHMMHIKAEDLERCARHLRRLHPEANELPRLTNQAQALREEGRALRIAQTKRTERPDTGHLAYLMEQNEASIRRMGDRQALGAQDYLQEYAIIDSTSEGQPVLWYAHFHYRTPDAPFTSFTAAHLKRAVDRYLSHEQPDLWRGTISPQVANRLFAPL